MEDNIVSAEDLLDDYGIKSVAFNTDKKIRFVILSDINKSM